MDTVLGWPSDFGQHLPKKIAMGTFFSLTWGNKLILLGS